MKDIVSFITKVAKAFGTGEHDREDAIDVLRLEYHRRRQEKRQPIAVHPFYGFEPAPPYPAMGGRARYSPLSQELNLRQMIALLEGAVPTEEDILDFFKRVERTEEELIKTKTQLDRISKAKKVVEVPDEARAILNEIATLDETKMEAKQLRRLVRQLSETARAYTAPMLIEDDKPDDG